MKDYLRPSARLNRIFRLGLLFLGIMTLMRIIFYVVFNGRAEPFKTAEALQAFWFGFRFDLRVTLFILLPLILLTAFSRYTWWASSFANRVWRDFYTFVFSCVMLIYFFDIGYYAYLESRMNATIFEYLKNPLISAGMLYQTYNLYLIVPVLFAVIFGFAWILKRYFLPFTEPKGAIGRPRKVVIPQSFVIALLLLLGIYGRAGQYPLRWSEAFFTQNNFIAYLAMNPTHYMVDTFGNRKKDFDPEKVKKHYARTAAYLKIENPNPETLDFKRHVELTPQFKTPNIVYIVMESMAAYKTGVFGNESNASPSLDRLAKSGWLFRNFFVPTEGTARSMFCVLSGIPDINAKSTSSRNPLIINQNTLFNAFTGYDKYYLIGGSANWGNIRGVYQNNIQGLKIFEEGSFKKPNTDIWGLSDLDLFRESARILTEHPTDKPFVALIQSASYHRPFTIPDDKGDFELRTMSAAELKKYGFDNNDEMNSFRFGDYSLGEFFRLIEKSEFYKNTIFIIHGDHGLPHYQAEHLPEGYKAFGLNRFHTPLVIYSPLIPEPKEFNMIVTEPDVLPTIAGLTGHQMMFQSLGRNVFAVPANEPRYAFSYVYYSDPLQVMLYDQEFLAYGTENGIESLHRYLSEDPKRDVKDNFPEKFEEMSDLLMGIFESSKYLLYHNPKLTE